MGFRSGAYAVVWGTPESKSNTLTTARISVSRKAKDVDRYEVEFSGFVSFSGSACAKRAMSLKERQRIRIGDMDCTNKYDKAKNTTYENKNIYSFFTENDDMFNLKPRDFAIALVEPTKKPVAKPDVDEVEPELKEENNLPF